MPDLPTRTKLPALVAAMAMALAAVTAAPALAARRGPLQRPTWLSGVTITEYFPAPESWFVGAPVTTPGLARKSRVDWLYSARGISMEGEGIGLDGQPYHIDSIGSSGWITQAGRQARFGAGSIFAPFWRAEGFWRNKSGQVTFPLAQGGWYAGVGKHYVAPTDITFAAGVSRPLRYYRSVAVDPKLIPLGSLVYAPAYKPLNGDGWFRADDTGGAIIGRHIDVFRQPPPSSSVQGRYLSGRRIFVVPKDRIAAYVKGAHGGATAAAMTAVPRPPASLLAPPPAALLRARR
ncbi:MAG TPA: 3D domain-containing protein [Solirubrobacteraceae bacterium]|nr:3D domain-containing protein [Solirubrobacteraceae bacterium]